MGTAMSLMNTIAVRLTLFLTCAASLSMAQDNPIALVNGNVFNGVDEEIRRDVTVLINAGRIERILETGTPLPAEYDAIDLNGFYLMPGLIDVHTHLASLDQARRALESGVTTVRSASVSAFQDVALRDLARSGAIPGPDVIPAGIFVTPDLGETLLADPRLGALVDGVRTDDELRLLVNINADRGAQVIKTRGTERAGLIDNDPRKQVYSRHQLRVIVEEARRRNMDVLVHAYGDEGARAAVLAGARSIEHGAYLSTETLEIMRDRGTWLVPTYVTIDGMASNSSSALLRLRGKMMLPGLEKVIRQADALGVNIATGVDTNYGPTSLSRISIELEQFVRLGMSNVKALQAATVSAAELLRVQEQTGRIEAGFEADMILIPENPLTNIEAVQDVLLVVSNGQIALQRFPFAVQ